MTTALLALQFLSGLMIPNESSLDLKRKAMVDEQIVHRGVKDSRVIAAMGKVPRHLYIPQENRAQAYEDRPAAIGYGQTISQPYIVGVMSELLQVDPGEKVLEVGTGSGYQAAVLAEMGAAVFSVEIIPELAQTARAALKETGYSSVRVKTGDGYQGWAEAAPYDAIMVTCAPESVPEPLKDQLKEGGTIVIPIGPENQIQELYVMKKVNGELVRQRVAPVQFVPMTRENKGKD